MQRTTLFDTHPMTSPVSISLSLYVSSEAKRRFRLNACLAERQRNKIDLGTGQTKKKTGSVKVQQVISTR